MPLSADTKRQVIESKSGVMRCKGAGNAELLVEKKRVKFAQFVLLLEFAWQSALLPTRARSWQVLVPLHHRHHWPHPPNQLLPLCHARGHRWIETLMNLQHWGNAIPQCNVTAPQCPKVPEILPGTVSINNMNSCNSTSLHCGLSNENRKFQFLATLVALHFTPVSKWVSQSVVVSD